MLYFYTRQPKRLVLENNRKVPILLREAENAICDYIETHKQLPSYSDLNIQNSQIAMYSGNVEKGILYLDLSSSNWQKIINKETGKLMYYERLDGESVPLWTWEVMDNRGYDYVDYFEQLQKGDR